MLPSSHKWLKGKKAIKTEECAKDNSTADECPLQKDGKQIGRWGQGGDELESVTDLGQKKQHKITS